MGYFVPWGLLALIVAASICAARLLIIFISRKLKKSLGIEFSVDSFGIFTLKDIEIRKDHSFSVKIKRISLISGFFHKDYKKPLIIFVGPVQVEILEKREPSDSDVSPSKSRDVGKPAAKQASGGLFLKFLFYLAQYIGLDATNITILASNDNIKLVCHSRILAEADLGNYEGNKRRFGVSFELRDVAVKLEDESSPIMDCALSLDFHASVLPSDIAKSCISKVKLSRLVLTCKEGLLKQVTKQRMREKESKHVTQLTREDEMVESLEEINIKTFTDKLSHIPKEVAVSLENCKIVYVSPKEREIYLSWECEICWKRNSEIIDENQIVSYGVSMDLTGLVINTTHNKLLINKQIECNVKLCPDAEIPSCSLTCILDTFHTSFIQDELQFWTSEMAILSPSPGILKASSEQTSLQEKRPNLLQLLSNLNCTANIKLRNCSCDFVMTLPYTQQSDPIFTSYLGEFDFNVQNIADVENCISSLRCNLTLQDLYVFVKRTEGKENCVEGEDRPAILPSSEAHVWGRVVEMGKIVFEVGCDQFKWKRYEPIYSSASGQMTYVAFEWSLNVAYALKQAMQFIGSLDKKDRTLTIDQSRPKQDSFSTIHMDAELRILNINLFVLGEREGGANSFLASMDGLDISTGSAEEPMLWQINGMKLSRLEGIAKGQSFRCTGSKSLSSHIVDIPLATACYFRKIYPKNLTVSIQNFSVDWNTTKHMVIYEQLNNAIKAKNVLQDFIPKPRKEKTTAVKNLQTGIKVDIIAADLKIQTSDENSFEIVLENLCVQSSHEETSVKVCDVDVFFDRNSIFKFQEVEAREISSEQLISARKKYLSISETNARAVDVSIFSCRILFPYQFDFATSMESLLNVVKMLKVLHKKPKTSQYKEPLPPDIHIKCNFLSFELQDDPFEVKLEENYLLRMDEMEECLERESKLIQKLNDIQGAFVSSKKFEAIMQSLAEKNAQIYIKRSEAIHQDSSKRTLLLKCDCRDVDLMIMADESMHGKDNVIKKMKEINAESPIPEGIEFSTLWCRVIEGKMKLLTTRIRDYQQPLMLIEMLSVSGPLIGAEQTGSEMAMREAVVKIGEPWKSMTVKKNMPPLKFYHDLSCNMDFWQAAWGVNFEPAFGTIAQSFDLLSKASVDPSPPLPFWDKIRLLLHGHLKLKVNGLNLILSASRDPNDTLEKMVIVWENMTLDWRNASFVIVGDFDLHIRTASKYDDSRVLHFPSFTVRVNLEWLCSGNPNDHQRATPCDPSKIKSTGDHDSYKLFRSQNLNISVNLETGKNQTKDQKGNPPTLFLYASTLRWLQKYQAVVLNNVSRPIRRGSYFDNVKARKPTLGRHYKFVTIDFSFARLRVNYFGSFTKDVGFEMAVTSGSFGVSYQVHVENVLDDLNLIRRPVANWILRDLRSELEKVSTDLISSLPESNKENVDNIPGRIDTERVSETYFLFSVRRVKYNRQSPSSDMSSFTHKVELNDFRGAWTAFNRKISFELLEAYTNMQMLKRVLSSEALKASKDTKSQDFRRQHKGSFLDLSSTSPKTPQEQHFNLLQQLVQEQESKFMAQAEEGETDSDGQSKSIEDDVIQLNWQIELINSQVMLKGSESKSALLITSSNTQIMKRLHRPVATNNDVVLKLNKVTWTGRLDNLQYFATVKELNDLSSNWIPWLNTSIFSGMGSSKNTDGNSNVAEFMKTSDSVGSIVNVSVNGITNQLQRVVSPCQCEFHYVSLDPELDPFAEELDATQYLTAAPQASFSPHSNLANTLLIRHPSLEISTSPEQYAMIMEICQTLLLYTEPKRKEQQDQFEKMKFRMQLTSGQDIKGDIQEMQNSVRDSLSYLRRCERQLYEYRRKSDDISLSMDEDSFLEMTLELKEAITDLQDQIEVTKEQLSVDSEELKIMISIYKDVIQNSSASPSPNKGRSKNYIIKQSDVIFDDMKWRLTQQDGQLGIADVQFKKFHYNKLTFNDNAGEHRLELGGFAVNNLIPNEAYKEALIPHEINLRRHVDKSVYLRVYCRVQSPVAGITIRQHFEVNVCPIAVRLTHRFYHYLMSFFFNRKIISADQPDFPELDTEAKGKEDGDDKESQSEEIMGQPVFKKPAPPRPPPPRPPQPSRLHPPPSPVTTKPPVSQPMSLDAEAEERMRKKSSMSLSLASPKETSAPSASPSSAGQTSLARTPTVKKSSSFYSQFSTDENVKRMRERATKNQTFIYIKIPEIPICFSYKGEKDRNIEDAHDFNLCLPTLEYHNRTWTWQDLLMALKKEYTQVLVPQIIKEKLHLKGGWDNKQSMATVGDDDKARLLLGDQPGTQKKTGKKLLFGKLSSLMTSKGASEATQSKHADKDKSSQMSGKGVDPLTLQDRFERLRTVSSDLKQEDS